ncbi:MAG TPA: FliM/FliN family flagellar motor C-terminal domain-containing protein [Candidatus Angelobacter sp.]|nr:FliM/FliN family flagellar motor C-terminal domain-containing protein [Candidatus Angelobacter sp.]
MPKKNDGNDVHAAAVQAKPAQAIAAHEDAGEAAGGPAKYWEKWAAVLCLPCDLTVELPVPGFKVGDLFRLQAKTVLESHWHAGEDVPLRVGGQLIGWGEFEVVGNHLAVRITELR